MEEKIFSSSSSSCKLAKKERKRKMAAGFEMFIVQLIRVVGGGAKSDGNMS